MRLLVGLGNPDPQHRYNRHNVGFMAVDAIVQRHRLGPWLPVAKGMGVASKGTLNTEDVLLLKPLTYMNASGVVVEQVTKYLKLDLGDIPELRQGVDRYVLGNFMADERSWVEAMQNAIAANAGLIATRRDLDFSDKINLAMEAQGFDDKWRRHRIDMNHNG
jgi:PTH1 family peptidyl-tRNA hydrolase